MASVHYRPNGHCVRVRPHQGVIWDRVELGRRCRVNGRYRSIASVPVGMAWQLYQRNADGTWSPLRGVEPIYLELQAVTAAMILADHRAR